MSEVMSHTPEYLGLAHPHSWIWTFRSPSPGNYGNEIDGMSKPVIKKKRDGGDGNEEESELLQNSSDDEGTDEGEFMSISTSSPMKPLITDRQVISVGSGSIKVLHVKGQKGGG